MSDKKRSGLDWQFGPPQPVPSAPAAWYRHLRRGKRLTRAVDHLLVYRDIKHHSRTAGAKEILPFRTRFRIHAREVICRLSSEGHWWKRIEPRDGFKDQRRCRICGTTEGHLV